jgi:hypothetical protein
MFVKPPDESLTRRQLVALGLALLVVLPVMPPARADAIIRTQAMFASTIAEYYIEDEYILLELEIGAGDLEAFGNLIPDEFYQRLGNPPRPLAERLVEFFQQDLVIALDGDRRIPGRILEMVARQRVSRDEITGEPLPVGEGEAETVVFARIRYPLPGRPQLLSFGGRASAQAGIGFVVYHKQIAVNDFRYLGKSQNLELDWDDPWYTRFEAPSLRRTYFAPMSGFLYVEPYEVRKEVIVRPKDIQQWLDLDLEGKDTIPVEIQVDLKAAVLDFLRLHQPVTIDGRAVEPDYARIDFLERSLKSSRVIDPPEDLDLNGAMLGVIFVYLIEGLPQRVAMDWDLFSERIPLIPAAAVDPAGPLPTHLEPDFAVLEWQNFLKNPVIPALAELAAPPDLAARAGAALRWPALVASLALLAWLALAFRRSGAVGAVPLCALALLLVVTAGSFWVDGGVRFKDGRTRELVGGLLHNVYRAFDHRQEERIYDVLEKSVEGELLTEIYLEARRGLELASQGGARAKVKDVELVDLEARPAAEGGMAATATWIVSAQVGHWGHLHQRRNRYRATLDIRPVDGAWKLAGIEILEEERI